MPIEGYVYDSDGSDRAMAVVPGLVRRLGERELLWVDVDLEAGCPWSELETSFELDRRSLIGLEDSRRRLMIENYGHYIQFGVLLAPSAGGDRQPRRLEFLIGGNWLITVHPGPVGFLRDFRMQDKGDTSTGRLSAADFAAALLDWHLESYFREVTRIEVEIDAIDDRILDDASRGDLAQLIHAARKRTSRLRRALPAQRPVFYGLERPDVIVAAEGASFEQLSLLNARYERALDEIERTRELVSGSYELLTSRTGQQTNELVKVLTFFTVIIGGAAAVAGLFGMNFDPPFFRSGATGFAVVTGGLLAFSAGAFALARRRGWL